MRQCLRDTKDVSKTNASLEMEGSKCRHIISTVIKRECAYHRKKGIDSSSTNNCATLFSFMIAMFRLQGDDNRSWPLWLYSIYVVTSQELWSDPHKLGTYEIIWIILGSLRTEIVGSSYIWVEKSVDLTISRRLVCKSRIYSHSPMFPNNGLKLFFLNSIFHPMHPACFHMYDHLFTFHVPILYLLIANI